MPKPKMIKKEKPRAVKDAEVVERAARLAAMQAQFILQDDAARFNTDLPIMQPALPFIGKLFKTGGGTGSLAVVVPFRLWQLAGLKEGDFARFELGGKVEKAKRG